ncbi:hypothetical protein ACRALDRAFT_1066742 [Sodiomyces alcalophilus JCM 7366]|uniref:uncharacterized protein n=1 Tax=Sodiomyces alcalophilus JCM 7366 TaxID=591952 RepID=UPI0039B5149D
MAHDAGMESKTKPSHMSFKEQLDQKAEEAHEPSQSNDNAVTNTINPIIKKVTEYVPATKSVLGDPDAKEKTDDGGPPPPGPPERPVHDDKIEEFMREQHRTKANKALD